MAHDKHALNMASRLRCRFSKIMDANIAAFDASQKGNM